jgi:hypothetical protein
MLNAKIRFYREDNCCFFFMTYFIADKDRTLSRLYQPCTALFLNEVTVHICRNELKLKASRFFESMPFGVETLFQTLIRDLIYQDFSGHWLILMYSHWEYILKRECTGSCLLRYSIAQVPFTHISGGMSHFSWKILVWQGDGYGPVMLIKVRNFLLKNA